MKLLTRERFNESVFSRDGNSCVICGAIGVDAHHIIERKLWDDGGYYLDNGATLCSDCHIKAESCEISCEEIREEAGIKSIILPKSLDPTISYNKWGEELNKKYIKYPRTFHLPWSEGCTSDDKKLSDVNNFLNKEVIITEKMDGENTTIYKDYCHARSINSKNHWTRDWVKALQATIGWEIPDRWRICGENLFGEHSISYNNLTSFFYVFSIWDEKNNCLSWRDTEEFCEILNLDLVSVLYKGVFDEKLIKKIELDKEKQEGYVVRLADSFKYSEFSNSVAKYVRENHVQTDTHWTKNCSTNSLK